MTEGERLKRRALRFLGNLTCSPARVWDSDLQMLTTDKSKSTSLHHALFNLCQAGAWERLFCRAHSRFRSSFYGSTCW